jgi:hypothetical protein
MYKIVGADQNEYGPVSSDQIQQWIAERRLNAQSLVQAEGSTEWKPLSDYPEFAAALASVAPAPAPAPAAPSPAPASVSTTNNMAIAGLVMGILTMTIGGCCCFGIPFNILGIVFSVVALSQINKAGGAQSGKGLAIAGLVLSILGTIGWVVFSLLSGFWFNFEKVLEEFKKASP